MKYLLSFALIAISLTSCSLIKEKSEESIDLKISTATPLKGRTIDSHVTIVNTEKAELAK